MNAGFQSMKVGLCSEPGFHWGTPGTWVSVPGPVPVAEVSLWMGSAWEMPVKVMPGEISGRGEVPQNVQQTSWRPGIVGTAPLLVVVSWRGNVPLEFHLFGMLEKSSPVGLALILWTWSILLNFNGLQWSSPYFQQGGLMLYTVGGIFGNTFSFLPCSLACLSLKPPHPVSST